MACSATSRCRRRAGCGRKARAEAPLSRGNVYLDKQEPERAIEDFEQAVQLKPDSFSAFYGRATAFLAKGGLDRAIQDLDHALTLKPDPNTQFRAPGPAKNPYESVHLHRASAYLRKKDYERAISDYDQAIKLWPSSWAAFNGRCWARVSGNRDLESALADCNEALRLRPEDPRLLDSRGFVHLRMGRFDQAVADANASLERARTPPGGLEPRSAGTLYIRGLAKRRLGDLSGSDADLASARQLDSGIDRKYAQYGVSP
jgi:tetratricopeptide (TPR) repeat protein